MIDLLSELIKLRDSYVEKLEMYRSLYRFEGVDFGDGFIQSQEDVILDLTELIKKAGG